MKSRLEEIFYFFCKLKFDEIYVENVGQHRAVGHKVEKKGKFSGRVKTTHQNKFQVKNVLFFKYPRPIFRAIWPQFRSQRVTKSLTSGRSLSIRLKALSRDSMKWKKQSVKSTERAAHCGRNKKEEMDETRR